MENTIMPNVTFRYEDGTATKVAVTAGENLLEVARKANVAIDGTLFRQRFPAVNAG